MSKEVLNLELLNSINKLIEVSKKKVVKHVNTIMLYWDIGRIIVEEKQKKKIKLIMEIIRLKVYQRN